MSTADVRKLARAKFSMEVSPSLKNREDRTLRGVVLLIGEGEHNALDYFNIKAWLLECRDAIVLSLK